MNIRHNKSGIILIIVIAAMSVLVVFAASAGESVSILTRYIDKEFARTRARASALAGINYALNLINLYPSKADSPWQSAVSVASQEEAQKYFYHVVLNKNARFDITIEDETRRLNLNALNETNSSLLAGLIAQYGFSRTEGDQAAAGVVEWVYKTKKAPLDDVTEILLAKGMTKAIFAKIKNDLTIYPKQHLDGLKFNYWTVSQQLYQVLIDNIKETRKVENIQTIISIAQKYRTKDKAVAVDPIELAMMAPVDHVPTATDYQVRAVGYDVASKVSIEINAVLGKDQDGTWHIERVDRI